MTPREAILTICMIILLLKELMCLLTPGRKRERNLLLDVMVIMYERRWFVEEAVPHVRRALRKCGALSLGAG